MRIEKRNLCADCGCFLQMQNMWNRRCIKQSSSKKRFPMVHFNTYDSSSLKKENASATFRTTIRKKVILIDKYVKHLKTLYVLNVFSFKNSL